MSSARAPAGSRGGNGLATVSPRRDRRAPPGMAVRVCARSPGPPRSPRSSPRGRGLWHSHFPSQGYPVSSQIFSASSVTVVVPVPLRREPLPVSPFSWAVFLWGRQGCCRGCRAHGCVLGDERQTEVTTKEKAVTRQDRSWGSSPGTAPRKASFRDGRGGFLSPAWAPDLVQPHPVSRLLRKLLLLFAWLLSPFLSLQNTMYIRKGAFASMCSVNSSSNASLRVSHSPEEGGTSPVF